MDRRSVLSLLGTTAFALSTGAVPDAIAQQPKPEGAVRIAVVTHGPASSKFWAIIRNGVEAASRTLDVLVDYRAPDVYSLARMSEMIDEAVAGRPDGLVVSIPEPGLAPAIRRAVKAGIPVVSINSGSAIYRRLGVLAHIAGCDECRQEAVALRALKQRMHSLGEAMVDAALTGRLMAMAMPSDGRPWTARAPWRPRGAFPAARMLTVGILASTVAGLGAAAFFVGGEQQTPGPKVTPAVDTFLVQHAIVTGDLPVAPLTAGTAGSPGRSSSGAKRARETAATCSIAEVRQSPTGGLSIKLHDKQTAWSHWASTWVSVQGQGRAWRKIGDRVGTVERISRCLPPMLWPGPCEPAGSRHASVCSTGPIAASFG